MSARSWFSSVRLHVFLCIPTVWCQPCLTHVIPCLYLRVFSSEHSLSYYLIKHRRDALVVIGFCTRGKGHRAEFVCVCAWISLGRRCVCVRALLFLWLHVCVMCLCWFWPVFLWFAVNHCVFRKLCGWVRHGGRGVCEGGFRVWPEAHTFYCLEGDPSKFHTFGNRLVL